MPKEYKFFVCIDFPDDLMNAPFDEEYLLKLFNLFKSWGIERIYWIYTLRHNEGLFNNFPCYQELLDNSEITYQKIGEFLPAAVKIAHRCKMELYAVYKPNDLAFDETSPVGSQEAVKYGKIENLSGRIWWAASGLVQLQKMRMERKLTDVPGDLDERIIKKIKLVSGSRRKTRIKKTDLRIFVSDDNSSYRRYKPSFDLTEGVERNRRVLVIDNLNIKNKYFAINTPYRNDKHIRHLSIVGSQDGGTFKNKLAGLVEVYDAKGEKLPFTYGLISRKDYYHTSGVKSKELIKKGYVFNWDNNALYSGFLEQTVYSLDNDRGYLAFARGKERYVTGILSPCYQEVQDYWLKHVKECLDAGVDGIDLRSVSHSRNFEWENYGFEKPIVEEYQKRYGVNILKESYSREKQEGIIAEYYTDFFRKAVRLIRKAGKKAQIHIGGTGVYRDTKNRRGFGRFQMGRKWEWERWIKEGLADEITLKNVAAWDKKSYDMVHSLSLKYNIPVYYCSYMKEFVARPDGPERFRKVIKKSKTWKQNGFIVYESAMILKELKNGRIKLLSSDIPKIIMDYTCSAL